MPHSHSGATLSLYATLSLGSYLISVRHTVIRELPYLGIGWELPYLCIDWELPYNTKRMLNA